MSGKKSSGFLFWIVVLLLVGGAAYGGWRYWQAHNQTTITYQTAPVQRGTVTQMVTASGPLNPVLSVTVGSQVSGIIKVLNADFNSSVTKGEIIAEIDPRSFQATLMQAQGNLANAKASLKLAEINAKRNAELRAENAIPQSTVDQSQADLEKAEAQVQIQQGVVNNAAANLSYCKIISPVDGTVISRDVDVGQTVAASMTAPTLFTIGNDLTKMQIEANVAEADVGTVKEKQDVDFTVDAFPYETFHGAVQQVRNQATTTNNVVTYAVVIEVSNPELKLRPGMTANVSIIIDKRPNVLAIGNAAMRVKMPASPTASVSPSPSATAATPGAARAGGRRGGWSKQSLAGGAPSQTRTVYVLKEGQPTPEARTIHVGITDGIVTEVTDGLSENEPVVTAVFGAEVSGAGAAQAGSNPFMPKMPGGRPPGR